MDIEKVHPQFRDAVKRVPNLPIHNRWVRTVISWLSARLRKASPVSGVVVEDRRLDHAPVRIYRPESGQSTAALFWIHGGGLVLGNPGLNDRECSAWVRDLGLVVISAGYRLAAKHPFPAALDDLYAAWQWLQTAAEELGIDPGRVVVSGQSAGGGLAASLVQRIHDTGGVQPVGQALLCPMLDDRTAARRELDAVNHCVWNNRSNRAGWSCYLGVDAGAAAVPQYAVAARREDLSGLPPAWIGVGDVDLFYEENRRYAQRLRESEVSCELETIPGGHHGFELLSYEAPLTQTFYASNQRFLRRVLGLPPPDRGRSIHSRQKA